MLSLLVSWSLVNELPARPPSVFQPTGGICRATSHPSTRALLLISSSRIGHHSTISYRYACKTLVRLNISPVVSCSLGQRATRTALSACQPTWTLLGYFPHVNIALPLTYSSRIRHYSTILPLHIQRPWCAGRYLPVGVLSARERAHPHAPQRMPAYRGLCQATAHCPRRVTTDLQFSDRPSQHNLIPLRMQDLDSHEFSPDGGVFSRESRATRTKARPSGPPTAVPLPGSFPHVDTARYDRLTATRRGRL